MNKKFVYKIVFKNTVEFSFVSEIDIDLFSVSGIALILSGVYINMDEVLYMTKTQYKEQKSIEEA